MDKDKRIELISVLIISALFIIVNVTWIWLFRHGQLFDIDEAGYFSISLVDFHALIAHGFIGWIKAVESPSIQAPVTTALSSLVYIIFGPRLLAGFFVIILSGVVTIIASYYLGKFIGGRRLGLITAILVATSPIVITYARDYTFALPAAAVTTVALLAIVCSDQFTDIKWSIIFGICLGLMPLTRTMATAFVPGLLVSAAIYVIAKSDNRYRRLCIMGLSLIIGIAIAAIWLIPNGPLVLHYLVGFGYGSRVAEYAASHESHGLLHNLTSWLVTIQYLAANVYLPDLVLMLAGLGLLVVAFARMIFIKGWRQAGLVILNSKMLPLVLLVVEGLIALTSSQNKGTGFIAPLVPAMLLLSAWAMVRLGNSRSRNLIIMGITVIIAAMSSVPLLYLTAPTARPWVVNIPLLGQTTVTDGRVYIQLYESAGGYQTQNPDVPINPQTAKLWIDASAITSQRLTQLNGNNNIVTAFGFRNRIYNVNTVNLQQLLAGRSELPLTQVDPEVTGDSVAGYFQWLTRGDSSNARLLVTATRGQGDIFPTVNDKYMAEAAQEAGFSPISYVSLPDERIVTLWERHTLTDINPADLMFVNKNTLYSIDSINGLILAQQRQPVIIDSNNDNFINVNGWAVDSNAGLTAGYVFLYIDGKTGIPVFYGDDRNDVANAFKNKNYRYSGFSGSLNIASLSKGQHILSIKVVTADKKGYYQPDQRIIFTII